MNQTQPYSDLNDALLADLPGIVTRLAHRAGRPAERHGNEYRIGNNGSISIELSGPKAGAWHDFETGDGGGPMGFIRHMLQCSNASAAEWARRETGITSTQKPGRMGAEAAAKSRARDVAAKAKADASAAAKVATAALKWSASIPMAGTLAERYLVETRCIKKPAAGWPECFRYHAGERALIVSATNDAGQVKGVQFVFLTPDAKKEPRKIDGIPKPIAKQSHGRLVGSAARLPGPADGPLQFAEGPETALSVWTSTGYETHFGFGYSHMGSIAPPPGRLTVVCRDDDPSHLQSGPEKSANKAMLQWHSAGLNVIEVYPWVERKKNKGDFNDILMSAGQDAVSAQINQAINAVETHKPVQVHRISAEAGHSLVAEKVGEFFNIALIGRFIPRARGESDSGDAVPVHAIRSTVGIGKTESVLKSAAKALVEERANGGGGNVVLAVPTHRLGGELAEKFNTSPEARAAGLVARVWRGRRAPDPAAPGKTMCQNLEAVKDAEELAADVETQVCKSEGAEVRKCQFYDVCGYQRQRREHADLRVCAHEMVFGPAPAILGEVAAMVVDESCYGKALTGVDRKLPAQITLDEIDRPVACSSGANDSADLADLRHKLYFVLSHHAPGPVTRAALLAEGFTPAMAARAYRLEWKRKITTQFRPGMSKKEWEEVKALAAGNCTLTRFSRIWKAVEEILTDESMMDSGRLTVVDDLTGKHGASRVVRLKGMKNVGKGFRVPTLLIDATMQLDLVRPIWPNVILTADIAVSAPHQRVIQVADHTFAESSVIKNIEKWHAVICSIARRYAPGLVLVIVQKAVEEELKILGKLPKNIDLDHHNNIAGRDQWRTAAALIVIGRTQPGPSDVEAIAEAMGGKYIPGIEWYVPAPTFREMSDGTHQPAQAWQHPHPIAEAANKAICEGEIVQIIGRPRGIWRTPGNPVDVYVLTSVVLPLPVSLTVAADDIKPTSRDKMLAAGGLAFENSAHAAIGYPGIWPSAAAARKARETEKTERCVSSSLYDIYNEKLTHLLRRVTYKPAGSGRAAAIALFDADLLPEIPKNPCAWLTERLGFPILWAGIDAAPAEPAPAPAVTNVRIAVIPKDAKMSVETDTEQAGLDPSTVYFGPMTECPPTNSWRVGGGQAIEESREIRLAAPSPELGAGWMVVHAAEHPGNPVAMRWGENEAFLYPIDAKRIPFGLLVAAWGADAAAWQSGEARHPDTLRPVVNRWVERFGPRGNAVERSGAADEAAETIGAPARPVMPSQPKGGPSVRIDPVTMTRHLVYDSALAA